MSIAPNEIIDRVVGMAFGTAVGDAMGIPFENLTPEQIAEIQMSFDKHPPLFVDTAGRNPYIPTSWPVGRWGDATQLSLAIMRAIATYLCANIHEKLSLVELIVNEHVKEWWDCTDGWGNGTKSAIERIARGSYTYSNSGGPSTGNGVMMKLTPIAFYYFACNLNVDEQFVESICRMTHASSVTIATAFIYIYLCTFILEHDFPSSPAERQTFLLYVHQISIRYEAKYKLEAQKDLLSLRIQRYLKGMDDINDALLLDVSHGGTFFSVDTLSMVVGLIVTNFVTFKTLEKALTMGGDTNIVAAMIGALLGARKGQQAIDDRRIESVYQSDYVRTVANEFGQALAQNRDPLSTRS